MALIFQALQYDYRDAYFGDPTGNWNEDNQHKEIVFTLHGNRQNDGESVAIGVRGFRPHLNLRLSDEDIRFKLNTTTIDVTSTLNHCRKKLKSLVYHVFTSPTWKRSLQDHVLVNDTTLEQKRPVFPFQEHTSVFLKVPFRTAAAFKHFVRSMQCVQIAHQNPTHSEASLRKEIEVVKLRIKQSTLAKENKKKNGNKSATTEKELMLTKHQEQNLNAKKEELKRLLSAFQQRNALPVMVQQWKWTLYNSKIDLILLFLKDMRCRTQWFEIQEHALKKSMFHSEVAEPGRVGLKAKHIAVIHISALVVKNDIETIAPFLQCSFDIEAYSGYYVKDEFGRYILDDEGDKTREFPTPLKPLNVCFQISMHFHRFGQPMDTARNHLLTLGNPALLPQEAKDLRPEERITVHRMNSERELLVKFFEMVNEHDVDVFLSYNGDGFDWQFIYHRSVMNKLFYEKKKTYVKEDDETDENLGHTCTVESGVATDLLTREPGEVVQLKYSVFSSSGAGTTSYQRLNIPGRLHIDLLKYMRDNEKIDRSFSVFCSFVYFFGLKK